MDDVDPVQGAAASGSQPQVSVARFSGDVLTAYFESLGGSGHGDEFGVFLDDHGAKTHSLLRWADLGHDLLMDALECRFDGVGLPENTIVFQPDHSDEWWTKDKRFWMAMRSFERVADTDQDTVTVRLCTRLQALRDALIADLESGNKIFVFKRQSGNMTPAEVSRMHAAVRAYGDATVFIVCYADELHKAGTVIAPAPGLLIGYIAHFTFSADNRPLGPVTDEWYELCSKAYQIWAGPRTGIAKPPPRPVRTIVLPQGSRRVVLIGNCQVQAMSQLYQRFAAARTGDVLQYIRSYEDITEQDRIAIGQADIVIEQLLDLKPRADTDDITTAAPRLYMPLVTAAFLWPFAGQAHPQNETYPFLAGGPYGGEAADSFINRLLQAGKSPEEAVDMYASMDIRSRVNLDRMYELIMDRQRSRDEATGYELATVIEQHFRTEQIFLSPYHPNVRVAVALATHLFQQLGAHPDDTERMQRGTRITPFPKSELPLHPSVVSHFGLTYITPDRRYRFMNEGLFTFREYMLRYARYEWNAELEEGLAHLHAGDMGPAREKLIAGLKKSPLSATGHNALGHILSRQGEEPEATVAAARRAVEIEPENASYRADLGQMLRQAHRYAEAEAELRTTIAAQPMEPHYYILLAHLLSAQDRADEGANLIRQAIEHDPYAASLYRELADQLEIANDLQGALQALESATILQSDNVATLHNRVRLLRRLGRFADAVDVAEAAFKLDSDTVQFHITLSELMLHQGRKQEALTEAYTAAVRVPPNARAYTHLSSVLRQLGDTAAAVHALTRAADLEPRDAHIQHEFSVLFMQQNHLPDAIAAARRATDLEPGNPHRLVHLATLLAQHNELDAATETQRRAVALEPHTLAFRVFLSDLLARAGQLQAALDEADRAVRDHPSSARALGHLAHIHNLMGNQSAAGAAFDTAILADP